jgi:hypothetical protein
MTPRLQRVLVPLSVTAAFAFAAPAALAGTTVDFPFGSMTPDATVTITDVGGGSSDTVQLTVTAPTHAALVKTKIFLGNDYEIPYYSVGTDGVRDARYGDNTTPSELSSADCLVYAGPRRLDDVTINVSGGGTGNSFTADLPKGEVIAFESVGVAVGVVDQDAVCHSPDGVDGFAMNYIAHKQDIDDLTWSAPAAPVVTATGGRNQVALSFDQERGAHYEIYKVVGNTPESTPLIENARSDGSDVQVVVSQDRDGNPLAAGTPFTFQVRAIRDFNIWDGVEMHDLPGPPSQFVSATTTPYQTVQFGAGPAASTTAHSAQFSWSITDNDAGATPWCGLDVSEASGTEVACSTTGAAVDGLAVGAHTLTVYPDYSSGDGYTYAWTVVAPAVTPPPAPPATPTTPKNPTDLDGDGIDNNWLVGGKAAPAPATPKASVSGGKVKLTLKSAPKGAKSVRVYRADGNGGYVLVKTLTAKSKTFTDPKVKPGHSYKYKTVAVNAKGQQGKASGAVTAKVKKK